MQPVKEFSKTPRKLFVGFACLLSKVPLTHNQTLVLCMKTGMGFRKTMRRQLIGMGRLRHRVSKEPRRDWLPSNALTTVVETVEEDDGGSMERVSDQ